MGKLYELEYFALNFETGEMERMKSDDYLDATDLSDAQKKLNMLDNPFIRLSGVFITESSFSSEPTNYQKEEERLEDETLAATVKLLSFDQFLDWCETMLPDLDYLDRVYKILSETKGLTKYKNALKAFITNERKKLNDNGESKEEGGKKDRS